MPTPLDQIFPPEDVAAIRRITDPIFDLAGRAPKFGPHISSASADNQRDLINRGLELVDAPADVRERVNQIIGEKGTPPATVHTFPLDQDTPDQQSESVHHDQIRNGQFDP